MTTHSRSQNPQLSQPELIQLTGESFQSYKAGRHFGIWYALNDAATNVQAMKVHYEQQFNALHALLKETLPPDHPAHPTVDAIPSLASGFDVLSNGFASKASEHQQAGNMALGGLNKVQASPYIPSKPWQRWLKSAGIFVLSTAWVILLHYAMARLR